MAAEDMDNIEKIFSSLSASFGDGDGDGELNFGDDFSFVTQGGDSDDVGTASQFELASSEKKNADAFFESIQNEYDELVRLSKNSPETMIQKGIMSIIPDLRRKTSEHIAQELLKKAARREYANDILEEDKTNYIKTIMDEVSSSPDAFFAREGVELDLSTMKFEVFDFNVETNILVKYLEFLMSTAYAQNKEFCEAIRNSLESYRLLRTPLPIWGFFERFQTDQSL